jgi:hypothetical protein
MAAARGLGARIDGAGVAVITTLEAAHTGAGSAAARHAARLAGRIVWPWRFDAPCAHHLEARLDADVGAATLRHLEPLGLDGDLDRADAKHAHRAPGKRWREADDDVFRRAARDTEATRNGREGPDDRDLGKVHRLAPVGGRHHAPRHLAHVDGAQRQLFGCHHDEPRGEAADRRLTVTATQRHAQRREEQEESGAATNGGGHGRGSLNGERVGARTSPLRHGRGDRPTSQGPDTPSRRATARCQRHTARTSRSSSRLTNSAQAPRSAALSPRPAQSPGGSRVR